MRIALLKSKFSLVLISLLIIGSCSNDDGNAPIIDPPAVSYNTTTIEAVFFKDGNSVTPTLDWNGNQGSFSLAIPITGLDINETTGVLNWTKNLPLGTHNLEVIATNSAGQTSVSLILNNPFQGIFTGVYDVTNFQEIEFNSDGTLLIREDDEVNPTTSTGTWTKTGNIIEVDYTYDDSPSDFSLLGTLTIGTSAVYTGEWFFGHSAIPGNEGGIFEVVLD